MDCEGEISESLLTTSLLHTTVMLKPHWLKESHIKPYIVYKVNVSNPPHIRLLTKVLEHVKVDLLTIVTRVFV